MSDGSDCHAHDPNRDIRGTWEKWTEEDLSILHLFSLSFFFTHK
jgi:hypothetical protein